MLAAMSMSERDMSGDRPEPKTLQRAFFVGPFHFAGMPSRGRSSQNRNLSRAVADLPDYFVVQTAILLLRLRPSRLQERFLCVGIANVPVGTEN
jgi:hypothetical protein